MRRLLERLSRDRVLRRRLPRDLGGGTVVVSPGAAMRLWRRDLEKVDPLLLGMARELVRPGMTVWDVGANVGLFAAAAAFLAGPAGRVVAIEADGWLAGLLRRTAAAQPAGRAPIDVLAVAVSEGLGVAEFLVARRGRAASHLAAVSGSTQAGGVRSRQQVVTVTLDWLLGWFPPPGLVKIDVEGAELGCLRGAAELLSCHRPVLLCEIGRDHAEPAARLLAEAGYTLYDASAPPAAREPLAEAAWNTLAVPVGGGTPGAVTAGEPGTSAAEAPAVPGGGAPPAAARTARR